MLQGRMTQIKASIKLVIIKKGTSKLKLASG